MHRPGLGAALLAALLVTAVAAPVASAGSTPVEGLSWANTFNRATLRHIGSNCVSADPAGWGTSGDRTRHTTDWGTPGADRATGSFDPVAQSGSAIGTGAALRFDAFPLSDAHSFLMSDVGIEVAAGRAYMTARLARIRNLRTDSVAKRVRIAAIAQPKMSFGPAHDLKSRPIADSFVMAVQGHGTIMKPFAAMLNSVRCSRKWAGRYRNTIRVGAPLGLITAQFLPSRATGLAGYVEFHPSFFNPDATPIVVTPTGAGTPRTVHGHNTLHYAFPAGIAIPLTCEFGGKCQPPAGTGYGLGGGFTMTLGDKSLTVNDLAASYTGDFPLTLTIIGTIDGSALNVASGDVGGVFPTDDFTARISDTFGAGTDGRLDDYHPTFTSTGPVQ